MSLGSWATERQRFSKSFKVPKATLPNLPGFQQVSFSKLHPPMFKARKAPNDEFPSFKGFCKVPNLKVILRHLTLPKWFPSWFAKYINMFPIIPNLTFVLALCQFKITFFPNSDFFAVGSSVQISSGAIRRSFQARFGEGSGGVLGLRKVLDGSGVPSRMAPVRHL